MVVAELQIVRDYEVIIFETNIVRLPFAANAEAVGSRRRRPLGSVSFSAGAAFSHRGWGLCLNET